MVYRESKTYTITPGGCQEQLKSCERVLSTVFHDVSKEQRLGKSLGIVKGEKSDGGPRVGPDLHRMLAPYGPAGSARRSTRELMVAPASATPGSPRGSATRCWRRSWSTMHPQIRGAGGIRPRPCGSGACRLVRSLCGLHDGEAGDADGVL